MPLSPPSNNTLSLDTGVAGTWADALLHSPWLNITEYRPRVLPTPTLASGAALPPEGTSACGTAGQNHVRMAGNGETYPEALNNDGRDLADRDRFGALVSFHSPASSPEVEQNPHAR